MRHRIGSSGYERLIIRLSAINSGLTGRLVDTMISTLALLIDQSSDQPPHQSRLEPSFVDWKQSHEDIRAHPAVGLRWLPAPHRGGDALCGNPVIANPA
jgi:hypothetical protein